MGDEWANRRAGEGAQSEIGDEVLSPVHARSASAPLPFSAVPPSVPSVARSPARRFARSSPISLFRRFLGIALFAASTGAAHGAERPNIIYVLLDDLGYSDIGPYGGEVATPTLDRLAGEGLRFTDFYNASKCEPTRASVMSGLYWPVAGLGHKRGITLGEAMGEAGYATFAVGKWHLDGNPTDRGFDRYFGHLSGASPFFPPLNPSFRLDDQPFVPDDPAFYSTDAMTDYAIEFIEESHAEASERPFFLYLAYNAPHNPLQAPREDILRYRGKYLKGWDRIRQERYQKMVEMGLFDPETAPLSPRPVNVPAWDSLTPEQQDLEDLRMSVYAAMVDRVDQNLARLLAAVDALGKSDNLLVIFMSDNGASPYWRTDKAMLANDKLPGDPKSNWEIGLGWANASNTPYRLYKRNQHQGGVLTPFIAWRPGVITNGGGWVRQPAHVIDLMPTFLDLAGAEYPARSRGRANPPLPGRSLAPLFRGEAREPHDALYFLLFDHAAIRQGDLKLARVDGRPWELFDLATDRTETRDLAAEKPEVAQDLEQAFNLWLRDIDMVGYNNPTPRPDQRDDRGEGADYVPSAMPPHMKDRYPLPNR